MAESTFANFHHVALVVRDLDKAIAYYQSLGIGPFRPPPVKAIKEVYRGKPIPLDYFTRKEVLAKMGEVFLQLCQPGKEDSPWKEFLDTRGEGVHHLCFMVDDIEKEEAEFARKGVEILLSSRFEGGGGACYLNISKPGAIYIELVERPKGVKD